MPIGSWVLSEACRLAQRWQVARAHDAPLTVRVNVSARQLAEADLPDTVAGVLADSEMDPAMLCLEVTESVLIEDPDSSAATLSALKALGVQIAVDDFGTGYSSLAYLRRFPVDCLKIDRSYIRGLPHSSEDAAIVAAVVDLAHALSLSVTAEGVESTDQLVNLRARGCDTAQGFLFARPEPPEVIERLLRPASAPLAQAR
ncbi:MAG TPA: EAL domain-containing protein [Solirubrobacteraceae bacterium]|nr:EAL domain-containing protein [Solirubrobacteraceae bacterium]